MEIGGVKIGLPKIGAKANANKPLANLKEPIKDTFIRHDDDEVRNATSEFETAFGAGKFDSTTDNK